MGECRYMCDLDLNSWCSGLKFDNLVRQESIWCRKLILGRVYWLGRVAVRHHGKTFL